MSSDKISSLEQKLKTSPDDISSPDLVYYLKYCTNHPSLNPDDMDSTLAFFKKIDSSFAYENIFVNTSNYTTILPYLIVLLLPFYMTYPRFYKTGLGLMILGIFALLALVSQINSLYSPFFPWIGPIFIGVTLVFYLAFFIFWNKLNHISLFFISAVIVYFLFTSVLKIILTIPIEGGGSATSATLNGRTDFMPYEVNQETACYQLMGRYKLSVPTGVMFYRYLTEFDIGENPTKISDFITNCLSPFAVIGILWLLQSFLTSLGAVFPLIGGDEYTLCQANYILPAQLNVQLLLHQILDKYKLTDEVYARLEKCLGRISDELLAKYNPLFIKEDKIEDNLTKNRILQKIAEKVPAFFATLDADEELAQLQEATTLTPSAYHGELQKIVYRIIYNNDEIPYAIKKEMFQLIRHIGNRLRIKNQCIREYENDDILARNVLLYDKNIKDITKPTLRKIVDEFIKEFKQNLHVPIKNMANNTNNENEDDCTALDNNENAIYGYHYNIIGYDFISPAKQEKGHALFGRILTLLSTWLLLSKPVGSPWLLMRLSMGESVDTGISVITRYFTTGLRENAVPPSPPPKDATSFAKRIFWSILLFIFFFVVLQFYNSACFANTYAPQWNNLLYQSLFIIAILGNIFTYQAKKSLITFNLIYFISIIIAMILWNTVLYFVS